MHLKAAQLTKNSLTDLLKTKKGMLFDCDGVLWRGNRLIEGADKLLRLLREREIPHYFLTNNSTRCRSQLRGHMEDLGLKDCTTDQILTSSFMAAHYFSKKPEFCEGGDKTVYVIGEQGISREFDDHKVNYLGAEHDSKAEIDWDALADVEVQDSIGAVLVGFDRHINYYKIQYAVRCLTSLKDCKFYCTNQDATTHFTESSLWAGGGSMVGAVKASVKREPINLGKPDSNDFLEYVREHSELSDFVMIGDRLDTDIAFGKANQLKTILVMSGVTDPTTLEASDLKPDYVCESVNDIYEALDD